MKRPLLITIFVVISSLAAVAIAIDKDDDIYVVDRFAATGKGAIPDGWKDFKFPKVPKATDYTVEEEGGDYYLKGHSEAAASVVYKRVTIDTRKLPILTWRWKIDNVLKTDNELDKAGDDHAARLFVVFEFEYEKATSYEKLKYHMAALILGKPVPGNTIGYIWANSVDKGKTFQSPYTDRMKFIAVESGDELKGKWVEESADVYADYKRLFNNEPPKVAAIAVMTDSEATSGVATGYYDDIVFAPAAATK